MVFETFNRAAEPTVYHLFHLNKGASFTWLVFITVDEIMVKLRRKENRDTAIVKREIGHSFSATFLAIPTCLMCRLVNCFWSKTILAHGFNLSNRCDSSINLAYVSSFFNLYFDAFYVFTSTCPVLSLLLSTKPFSPEHAAYWSPNKIQTISLKAAFPWITFT